MKRLIVKHPVITFFVINLFTATLLGLANMTLFPTSMKYMLLLPQFAPTVAAISVIMVLHGKSGLRDLRQTASLKKSSFKWSLVACIVPVAICGLSYIAFCLIENKQLASPEFSRPLWNYALCLLFTLLGSYGEEFGWRGFMLPQLQKKHSLFISSLIVGFFWGIWHMKFQSGIVVFALYTFLVVEFSLIISWLYGKTKGNIISAIIFHSAVNFCSLILFEKIISSAGNQHLQIVLYGVYAVVFLIPCVFIVKKLK